MVELITSRITATVLWMPESWEKRGISREDMERKVVRAVQKDKNEIEMGVGNSTFYFWLEKAPLESKPDSIHGMVELNSFTLDTMTRYYLRLSQIL